MSESTTQSKMVKCQHYFRVFVTHLFSHVGLCGLVVGYAIIGAITFESLEAPNELTQRSTLKHQREKCLGDLWNITLGLNVLYEENWTALVGARLRAFEQEVVSAVKNEGYDGKEEQDDELQWSFSGALLYCITVITTIGYGNIAPKTDVGKVVTIFYALLGIPLMLLCLTNIGDLLARSFKFTYSHLCFLCRNPKRTAVASSTPKHQPNAVDFSPKRGSISKIAELASMELCNGGEEKSHCVIDPSSLPAEKSKNLVLTSQESVPVIVERVYRNTSGSEDEQRVPMYMVLLLVTGYICGGAVLFSLWEKWSFLNGAYFCFITLSTIGFGDLVPGSDIFDARGGQAKLIICCAYLVLGLSIIAMSFNLVQAEVVIKCRNLARNLGLIKSDQDDDD